MVRVKVCGITNMRDAEHAVECGADAIGFVFWKNSPRYISPDKAASISRALPPFVNVVGVFVNTLNDKVAAIVERTGCDAVQLHGDERPVACEELMEKTRVKIVKSFRVRTIKDITPMAAYKVSAYLLDTFREGVPGGTGERFDWNIAIRAKTTGRIILAGGLNPENVADAVKNVAPYGVDVSSGVEKEPGIKDHAKVARFIEAAKSAECAKREGVA